MYGKYKPSRGAARHRSAPVAEKAEEEHESRWIQIRWGRPAGRREEAGWANKSALLSYSKILPSNWPDMERIKSYINKVRFTFLAFSLIWVR